MWLLDANMDVRLASVLEHVREIQAISVQYNQLGFSIDAHPLTEHRVHA